MKKLYASLSLLVILGIALVTFGYKNAGFVCCGIGGFCFGALLSFKENKHESE